jgi:two-component system sensor histidine kinase UhpB
MHAIIRELSAMSLTLRLIILILVVVFSMLAAGAVIAIHTARETVDKEIQSSARLTLQLLTAAIISSGSNNSQSAQNLLVRQLQELDNTRHLDIVILHPNGSITRTASRTPIPPAEKVPHWFTELIAPSRVEHRRRLGNPGSLPTEILIVSDPADEIRDIWNESVNIVALILVFTAVSLMLIIWVVRRSLQPLALISDGLGVIEAGDFKTRLPDLSLPDLNSLSASFNHMAGVLQDQQQENRRLSKRALDIAETERRHLARELHDELGQSISAIKAVAVSIKQDHKPAQRAAGSIIDISDHIYRVLRDMVHRLRPVVLDELGLQIALETLVDDFNTHHEDTFCILRTTGKLDNLGELLNIQLYRIVQEALTNVVKHARATEVQVSLARCEKGAIELLIRDNGEGFDATARHQGMGLPGLRERVNSINGNLSIESSPGAGVKINISINDEKDEFTSTPG